MEPELRLYDASLVITFPSENIDDADAEVESIISVLEGHGWDVGSIVVEESVQVIE